jgi:hypothetical protein
VTQSFRFGQIGFALPQFVFGPDAVVNVKVNSPPRNEAAQ